MLPNDRLVQSKPIAVAEKIIADISTGIYRTPAAALKELIANAYDADATITEISTGAPTFTELVVKDNGTGMSLDRFLDVLQHIGGSWKRIINAEGKSPLFQRPLIGRIGIGLLAVAQLGQRFYVSSSQKGSTTRFLAEVDLTPFHKDDAALRTLAPSGSDSSTETEEKIEIGVVRYVDGLPEQADSQFTVITVPDPKRGLVSEMYSQLREAIGASAIFSIETPAADFEDLALAALRHKRADAVLDGYHYVLWELGLLAPVKYLNGGPFDPDIRAIEGLEGLVLDEPNNFSVAVDGYDIRRPIRFPNPAAVGYASPDPKIYPVSFSQMIAGRQLSYQGYIYSQKPHIDPVELLGVQIRVRGVGIGGFDRTWMGYPFDEGLKFGQITGEIFVTDGLESALNIDRASFRETDPHYLTLRANLWSVLRSKVFPEFKSRQDQFRKTVKARQREQHRSRLIDALSNAPEVVEGPPRIARAPKEETVFLRDGWRGRAEVRTEAKQPSDRQTLVRIVDGQLVIDEELFREAAVDLKGPAKDTLLNICTVIAAFGIWDNLNQEAARDFFKALAVAVSQ